MRLGLTQGALMARLRLVEADSVVIQYRSYRTLQGRPGLDIGSFGGEFGGTRLRDVTLILDHEKAGRGAFHEFELLGVQRFDLQFRGLDGRVVGRAGAAHADQRVLHFKLRLIAQLALADLGLAKLQLIAHGVRLRHAVAHRQREL